MLSIPATLFGLSCVFVVVAIYSIYGYVKRCSFAHDIGCKKPRKLKQELFLVIQMLRESYDALCSATYLRLIQLRHCRMVKIFAFERLVAPRILTIEPADVKAILSDRFEDFGVVPSRAKSFEPLNGHGMFTTDTAA